MRRLAVIVCCVVAVAACSSSSKSSGTGPSTTTPAATSAPTTTTVPSGPRAIGHVFVINLENSDYDTTWGAASPARYLNATLRKQGKLLTQYYGIGHASLDNYIAEVSGQSPNPSTQSDCIQYIDFEPTGTGTGKYGQALGKGCVYPKAFTTIGDQLTAGKTWRAYQEDMGTPCRHPAIGTNDETIGPKPGDMYATRHNPFVYFHSIIDAPAACAKNVVDFDRLPPDLRSVATTPNFSFITPNVCHDGHDAPCVDGEPGGLVSADRFLTDVVPKILASPAYKADGMLVITLDEATITNSAACCNTPVSPNVDKPGLGGPGGGRIGTLLISAQVKPGTSVATPYNHYALLCSLEDIFGLKHLGFAGAPGLTCFGKDVYDGKP